MFNKTLIAMAVTAGMMGSAHAAPGTKQFGWQHKVDHVINADVNVPTDHSGRNRYMVQLVELPAAMRASEILKDQKRETGILGFKSRKNSSRAELMQATLRTPAMASYRYQMSKNQTSFMSNAKQALNRELKPVMKFDVAYNGMVLDLMPNEAEALLKQPQVMRVIKEVPNKLMTDNGPQLIGADQIWEGTAVSDLEAKGEGVIIGVLDTGINTDNRAFAATGDDGFTVQNPLGSGNYLGDCSIDAGLCNDKLIGVYSYDAITANYAGVRPANGEDYNGHGSHTASTAGGNMLRDVPVLRGEANVTPSDGIDTGSHFDKISGVAPHANVIAYQVCDNNGCYPSLTVQSVEHAIEDGVDVLNYSIGPTGGVQADPWGDSAHAAFLSAREAGIFVATAAGNDGYGTSTVGNNSPWTTVVGATTHERSWVHDVTGTSDLGSAFGPVEGFAKILISNGTNTPPPNVVETPVEVVYAGDYTTAAGYNLALCDVSIPDYQYPMDEWNGKIVICDRGENPLVEKVENIKGVSTRNHLAGVIIRNTAVSAQNMVSLNYGSPTALIDQAAGEALMDWMSTTRTAGDIPKLAIGAAVAEYKPELADVMAPFSSRGPYAPKPDVMVPHISAPGVEIYAAYSDDQPFSGAATAPSDFSFLSGTSMATPHVAGAAALVRQVHPDWTPAEIQSAMMLTANQAVTKADDGATTLAAGFFDTGSGRLQVDNTVQAGLIMDVPLADYMTVSPQQGGDYTALNMPYLSNSACAGMCTWSRTFTATGDTSWTVSTFGGADGLTFSASPSSFSLKPGESITVKFTANLAARVGEDWSALRVNLTPADASPVLSMPVMLKPMIADIPATLTQEHFWSSGAINVGGARFRYPQDALVNASRLEKATTYPLTLAADSNNESPFDDIADGTAVQFIDVPEGSTDLRVIVGASSAEDVDLFIGLDSNHDGIPQVVEITQTCGTVANVGEQCQLNAGAGRYWVLVHNYEGSGNATDDVRLDVLMRPATEALNTSAYMDSAAAQPYDPVDVNLDWLGEMGEGVFYGALEFFDRTSSNATRVLGDTTVIINRSAPTAQVTATQPELSRSQQAAVTVTLPGNSTPQDVTYLLMLDSSDELVVASAQAEGNAIASVDGNGISITVPAGAEEAIAVVNMMQETAKAGDFTVAWALDTDRDGFSAHTGEFVVSNSNQAPSVTAPMSLSGASGETLTLTANGSDANDNALTFTLVQTRGPAIASSHDGNGKFELTLPQVDDTQTATFELTVSDGDLSGTQLVQVTIEKASKKKRSGGSAGFGFLLLGLMAGLLRRKRA